MAKLLITGKAGFIGSHTCLELLQAGHHLVALDDFSNSSPIALERVGELAEAEAAARLTLLQGDIRNRNQLDQAFARASAPIDAVYPFRRTEGRRGVRAAASALLGREREWQPLSI